MLLTTNTGRGGSENQLYGVKNQLKILISSKILIKLSLQKENRYRLHHINALSIKIDSRTLKHKLMIHIKQINS